MLAAGVVLGLLSAIVRGADWNRLADARWRLWPLVLVGLGIQFALYGRVEGRTLPDLPYAAALYVLSHVLVLASFAANWRLRGVPLLLIGALLNLAAIAANGGQMPSTNRGMSDATPLWWLGDWLELPLLPRRLFSVGDLFLAAGAAITVYGLARRR